MRGRGAMHGALISRRVYLHEVGFHQLELLGVGMQRSRGEVEGEEAVLRGLTLPLSSLVAGCLRYEKSGRAWLLPAMMRERITWKSRDGSKRTTVGKVYTGLTQVCPTTLRHSYASSMSCSSFTTCSCLNISLL